MRDKFNKKDKCGRDFILEYASFGSNVYAPLTRNGRNPDRKSFKLEMQSDYLTTYDGIIINVIFQRFKRFRNTDIRHSFKYKSRHRNCDKGV
jgi:hypothetical protein